MRSATALSSALVATLSLGLTVLGQAPAAPPAPTGVAGPDPPALTQPAAEGNWKPGAQANGSSLTSMGRGAYVRSATDFCLYFPPDPTKSNLLLAEGDAVSYCTDARNGSRPMPDGLLLSAHYTQTPTVRQVIGSINPAVMNLAPNDCGTEYDSRGAAGVGNPPGSYLTDGNGDWFQFMGGCDFNYAQGQGPFIFVIRTCFGPTAERDCDHRYDLMGATFVAPGPYTEAGFTNCDVAGQLLQPGVYNASYTFTQGDAVTPLADDYPPAPSTTNCRTTSSPAASGVTYTWNQYRGGAVQTTGPLLSGTASVATATGLATSRGAAAASSSSTSTAKSATGSSSAAGASAQAPAYARTALVVGLPLLVALASSTLVL